MSQLLTIYSPFQTLGAESNRLREFAQLYREGIASTFAELDLRIAEAIPAHFTKLQRRYNEEVELRRALHNILVEMRGNFVFVIILLLISVLHGKHHSSPAGNIRVMCRVKPGAEKAITHDALDGDAVVVNCEPSPKRFLFDKVFGQEATQDDVRFCWVTMSSSSHFRCSTRSARWSRAVWMGRTCLSSRTDTPEVERRSPWRRANVNMNVMSNFRVPKRRPASVGGWGARCSRCWRKRRAASSAR